jgi:hypothetical protein
MMRGWPLPKLLPVSGYASLFRMALTPALRNSENASRVGKSRQHLKGGLLRLWTRFEFNQAHIGVQTKLQCSFDSCWRQEQPLISTRPGKLSTTG